MIYGVCYRGMAKQVVILIFLPEARKVLQVNLRRTYANYDISLHRVYIKVGDINER